MPWLALFLNLLSCQRSVSSIKVTRRVGGGRMGRVSLMLPSQDEDGSDSESGLAN